MTDARFEEMSRILAELGRKHGESHPSWTLQGMLHEGTLDGELPAKLMKALEGTGITAEELRDYARLEDEKCEKLQLEHAGNDEAEDFDPYPCDGMGY